MPPGTLRSLRPFESRRFATACTSRSRSRMRAEGWPSGAAFAPVPEVHGRGRRQGPRASRVRPRSRHLQGPGGGPRGPHLGSQRRTGPGHAIHLHDSGGRRARCRGRLRPEPVRPRPARDTNPVPILVVDDDPQTLRYVREALAEAGYSPIVTGEHRELSPHHQDREAPPDSARPSAPGRPMASSSWKALPRWPICRSSSSPPTAGTRPSPEGVGERSRRLPRQALLAHRTHRQDPGGPAQASRTGTLRARATSPSSTSSAG